MPEHAVLERLARSSCLARRVRAYAVIYCVALGCGCSGAGANLASGDTAPSFLGAPDRMTVAVTASVDDCLSCDLRGVFVSLRALQSKQNGSAMPEVVVFAVAAKEADTLFFRQTLDRERVAGRIMWVTPSAVSAIVDRNRLPAMFFIDEGRVVEVWQRNSSATIVTIERDELVRLAANRS